MWELSLDNAHDYLRAGGFIPADVPVEISPLGGGISNIVLKVEWPGDGFVLKQSLPKLRVKDDWPFDRDRIFIERDCMTLMGGLLPAGSMPQVRFSDPANYVFAMSIAPPGGVLWKDALMRGDIDLVAAERVGNLLADWHNLSAGDPQIRERFADPTNFLQGRIDPYHRTAAAANPDLAPVIEAEVERMLAKRLVLVHGDYSPKNIFIYPGHILTLDFEVAHWGDPAFDTAFCLSHLILKSLRFPERCPAYIAAGREFWQGYRRQLIPNLDPVIEMTTIRELGCLLLARIDGKSKIEYITDDATRHAARQLARAILPRIETFLVGNLASD